MGGLIGFFKAGSVASLVASSVCAGAILLGVRENQKLGKTMHCRVREDDTHAVAGGDPRAILLVSVLLLGFFGNKYR